MWGACLEGEATWRGGSVGTSGHAWRWVHVVTRRRIIDKCMATKFSQGRGTAVDHTGELWFCFALVLVSDIQSEHVRGARDRDTRETFNTTQNPEQSAKSMGWRRRLESGCFGEWSGRV